MTEVNQFQLKVYEILISSQQVAHLFGAGLRRMKKKKKTDNKKTQMQT